MGTKQRTRRTWSREEKVFFAQMLTIPTRRGTPETISEVSANYPVFNSQLSEWRKIFAEKGENGFDHKKRDSIDSKYKDDFLANRLSTLCLQHPEWGARKLINALEEESLEEAIPSIPTILKILGKNNLGDKAKRFCAAEYEYFRGTTTPSPELIELMNKQNPYLRLLESNRRVDGMLFLLKSIPLSQYFGKSSGSLFIAIEANSLMTFAKQWDGNDMEDLATLIHLITGFGEGRDRVNVYHLIEDSSVFTRLVSDLKLVDTRTRILDKKTYFNLIKVRLNLAKEFLKSYEFLNIEKFSKDFDEFLMRHNLSNLGYGYPTFGGSPYDAFLNHQKNMYYNRIA